ncbi:MAG TPA: (2Fe-2S)-binding protein [Thermoanaerobaculia bacterium]|nr:(2Fe-2S)-binding protein [Thermoanaerobaculia bacterium]
MIVCLCYGKSDRDIRSAIDNGASCLAQLEQCGIGGQCRGCEGVLERMIDDAVDAGRVDPCAACCKNRVLATA